MKKTTLAEFPNYVIYENGDVYSTLVNKKLKPSINNCGYLFVYLFDCTGKRRCMYIHRLIAISFIENTNNYKQVNHINGVKTDNRISNLEWCTNKQNALHAVKLGLIKTGLNAYNHRKVVCSISGKIYSVKEAANKCSISHQYMSKMLLGQRRNRTSFTYLN